MVSSVGVSGPSEEAEEGPVESRDMLEGLGVASTPGSAEEKEKMR